MALLLLFRLFEIEVGTHSFIESIHFHSNREACKWGCSIDKDQNPALQPRPTWAKAKWGGTWRLYPEPLLGLSDVIGPFLLTQVWG